MRPTKKNQKGRKRMRITMRGGKWTFKNGKWVKNNSIKLAAKQATLRKVPALMHFTRKSGSVPRRPSARRSTVRILVSPEINTPTSEEFAERLGTAQSYLTPIKILEATRHSAPKRMPSPYVRVDPWEKFGSKLNRNKNKKSFRYVINK